MKGRVVSFMLTAVMLAGGIAGSGVNLVSAEGETPKKIVHMLTLWNEDTLGTKVIKDLTTEYQRDHPEFELEIEVVAATDIVQKLNVLAASNELPDIWLSYSNSQLRTLIEQGWVANLDEELEVSKYISDVVRDGLMVLDSTDALYEFPSGNNIEGIWYNKDIFEENGFEIPKTLEEMMEIADACIEKGIQPFSCAGKEQWPLSRLIGSYLNRKEGNDYLIKINKGEIDFDDPSMIEAFQWIQDMGNKGYFGEGVATIDENVAQDVFLQGRAAMFYMGSWATEQYNNPEVNKLGENIGFFGFPELQDGKTSQNSFIQNFGTTFCFNAKTFDDQMKDWVDYIFSRYGDYALENLGVISGYNMSNNLDVEIPYYTKMVMENIEKSEGAGMWPEYALPQKTRDRYLADVQMLVLGEMTPEDVAAEITDSMKSKIK